MKIRFLKSPTGVYKLAYNAGEVIDTKEASLKKPVVDDLVKFKYAEKVPDSTVNLYSLDQNQLIQVMIKLELRFNKGWSKFKCLSVILAKAGDTKTAKAAIELGYFKAKK